MPKEKYDPPDPRRMYTIMSSEEAANGKKSYWAELEIVGNVGVLSGGPTYQRQNRPSLLSMTLLNATSGSSLLYAFLVFVLVIPKENVCTNSSM